jgi:hypothetical protein
MQALMQRAKMPTQGNNARLWLGWVLASTTGGALAGAIASATPLLSQALASLGLFESAAEALLIGLAISLPQWFVLRGRLRHAVFWIPTTTLGVAIGIGLAAMISVAVVPRALRGIGLGAGGLLPETIL